MKWPLLGRRSAPPPHACEIQRLGRLRWRVFPRSRAWRSVPAAKPNGRCRSRKRSAAVGDWRRRLLRQALKRHTTQNERFRDFELCCNSSSEKFWWGVKTGAPRRAPPVVGGPLLLGDIVFPRTGTEGPRAHDTSRAQTRHGSTISE